MFRNMIMVLWLVLDVALPASAIDTLQVTTPDPILVDWRWTTFDRSSGLAGLVDSIFEDRDRSIRFVTKTLK